MFEKQREEWANMDPKFKWILIGIAVVGPVLIAVRAFQNSTAPAAQPTAQVATAATPAPVGSAKVDPTATLRVLPRTDRNQGLEDLTMEIARQRDELARLKGLVDSQGARAGVKVAGAASAPARGLTLAPVAATAVKTTSASNLDKVTLDDALAPPVDFEQLGAKSADSVVPGRTGLNAALAPTNRSPAAGIPGDESGIAKMKVWASEKGTEHPEGKAEYQDSGLVIPVNSGIEAVMLTGVNARPSGSVAGAVGSATSANNVGAPFVTRLKGEAMLPNGWKLSDLGDCFLGGSAVAVLSTERAYAIADSLSCVGQDGEVYEGKIKAYGVDVDGTLGIAGKVVSKQGALLLQAALTGMASGLGSALAPTALPSYNSSATSGSQTGIQYPNPAGVAYTAVGQGINTATAQLSKFYLEYAKETFPVVEVTAATRVTWILKESIELKHRIRKERS